MSIQEGVTTECWALTAIDKESDMVWEYHVSDSCRSDGLSVIIYKKCPCYEQPPLHMYNCTMDRRLEGEQKCPYVASRQSADGQAPGIDTKSTEENWCREPTECTQKAHWHSARGPTWGERSTM